MAESNEPATPAPNPCTSRLAEASFILSLLSLSSCLTGPILILPAIICGILALSKIEKSHGQLLGKGLAVTGIIISILIILLGAFIMPSLGRSKPFTNRINCGKNLRELGFAVNTYASRHAVFPPADQWCDLLIRQTDASPEEFICPASEAIEGECTYAININVAGKKDIFPADVVLLFEADLKENAGPRSTPLSARNFYSFMEEYKLEWIAKNKDSIVYSEWWNLSGGPELLSTRYHNGEGCNVTYVDGHSAHIPVNEIHNLRWTYQEPNHFYP